MGRIWTSKSFHNSTLMRLDWIGLRICLARSRIKRCRLLHHRWVKVPKICSEKERKISKRNPFMKNQSPNINGKAVHRQAIKIQLLPCFKVWSNLKRMKTGNWETCLRALAKIWRHRINWRMLWTCKIRSWDTWVAITVCQKVTTLLCKILLKWLKTICQMTLCSDKTKQDVTISKWKKEHSWTLPHKSWISWESSRSYQRTVICTRWK